MSPYDYYDEDFDDEESWDEYHERLERKRLANEKAFREERRAGRIAAMGPIRESFEGTFRRKRQEMGVEI